MTEKKIQTKILYYLRKTLRQGIWIKIPQGMFSLPGVSDIIGCFFGGFFAFEVKSATGKPTVPQKIFIKAVRKAGGQAHIVRSVQEVKEIIDEYTIHTKSCSCIREIGLERHTD